MRNLLFILTLIFFMACQKHDDSKFEDIGIYKDINSFKIIMYKISDENEKDTFQIKQYKYNRQGKLIKSITTYPIYNDTFTSEYKYNSDNELIKEICTPSKTKQPYIIEYNKINDTLASFHLEINDENFTYIESGIDIYDSNNKIKQSKMKTFHFDLNKPNDTIVKTKSESFYKNGFCYKKNSMYYNEYTDSINNVVSKYFKDDKNRLIKMIEISNGKETESIYEYEYDKYGSWIKQTTIENRKITWIEEREIDYK